MVELLESAPPEQDMGPEASRRFVDVLRGERDLLLLIHEYWSQAVRDPELRARYAERQANLRASVARALRKRVEHLGGPADRFPDELLGEIIVIIYAGIVARAGAQGEA
jgi:hypothetical protein